MSSRLDPVADLVGDRHHLPGVVGQRGFGHQDEVFAAVEPAEDLLGRLAPGELAEELLDVGDLQGALFEAVVLDEVVHAAVTSSPWLVRGQTACGVRSGHSAPARDSRPNGGREQDTSPRRILRRDRPAAARACRPAGCRARAGQTDACRGAARPRYA